MLIRESFDIKKKSFLYGCPVSEYLQSFGLPDMFVKQHNRPDSKVCFLFNHVTLKLSGRFNLVLRCQFLKCEQISHKNTPIRTELKVCKTISNIEKY